MRTFSHLCSFMVTALYAGQAALGSFHLMQIEQVMGGVNGNTTVQVIQLRMRSAGQNLVSQARLVVRDPAGNNPVVVRDFTTNVLNSAAGSRILVATGNLPSFTSPPLTPDFTMTNSIPASYLAAGTLTFESDTGTVYWRLSWGGASYTGPGTGDITNDADGDFNPPFSGPLPTCTTQALQFRFAAGAASTNNANDYALTGGAAVVTRNDGGSAPIAGPAPATGACCLEGEVCQVDTACVCSAMGGTYQGNGTTCTPNPCAPPTGACCQAEGLCQELVADDCSTVGGVYRGDGTACDSSCPVTAGQCGDQNNDAYIDLDDFAAMFACHGGPGSAVPPSCQKSDLDGDIDVDLVDFSLLAERFNAYAGFAPACEPNGPRVRSDALCYLAGDSVWIYVDVPPVPAGSLRVVVFEDDENEEGAVALDETRPLDGSPTYTFVAELPREVMYNAAAVILDQNGQELGSGGLSLGVRPNLPNIPGEICTFETFTVDAEALRIQVEAAVSAQTPMSLQIGSRRFDALLESNEEMVAPEILAADPTLGLFRGQLIGSTSSEVKLTFYDGLVNILVDQEADESSVYMESAYEHDPSLPFDMYIGYLSDDVRLPALGDDTADPHGAPRGAQTGQAPSPASPLGAAPAPYEQDVPATAMSLGGGLRAPLSRVHLNVYYDSGSLGGNLAHFANMDSTFWSRLGVRLFINSASFLNTDSYQDDPGFLSDFRISPLVTLAGCDIATLLTRNGNVNYGNTLGRAYWTPGEFTIAPYGWILRQGSSHQIRCVGCHELSHNLGASDRCGGVSTPGVDCAHNPNRTRRHRHCRRFLFFFRICWRHTHYSIMHPTYEGDDVIDSDWLAPDRDTVLDTIAGNSRLVQIEQVIAGVNGNTTVQAVQLRLRTGFQNILAPSRLVAYDATGAGPVVIRDFTTNVPVATQGARVLIATGNLPNFTSPPLTPDFIMTSAIPASYLAAGSLVLQSDAGTPYWRLSWGGASYAGPGTGYIHNDNDQNFSPAFPSALPSGSTSALRYQWGADQASLNNAFDYALTAGAAVFTRNSGASATIIP